MQSITSTPSMAFPRVSNLNESNFDLSALNPDIIKAVRKEDPRMSQLVDCFEKALLADDGSILSKFKKTQVISVCLEQTTSALIIRKLVEHDFIEPDEFSEKVTRLESSVQESLTKEFKNIIRQEYINVHLIEKFLRAGVQYDQEVVWLVVKTGKVELVKIFQDKGADVGRSLFMLIENNQTSAFYTLFDHSKHNSLDPNLQDCTGKTLLRAAVEKDRKEMVEYLLASGANPLILDDTRTSIFELARGNSSEIQTLLYQPDTISSRRSYGSSGWSNEKIEQEKILRESLNRLCQGQPAQNYYALFIRVHEVVMVILKAEPFSGLPASSAEANTKARFNYLLCWSDEKTYPLPAEFCERSTHNSMYTLAFAIFQPAKTLPKQAIPVSNNWYLLPLVNKYKANNSGLDVGFKYSYKSVMVHGHGRNPEAARSALKEHEDGLRPLEKWIAPPDLSSHQSELISAQKEVTSIFEEEQENRFKLEGLVEDIKSFIRNAGSLMDWRGEKAFLENDLHNQNEQIEQDYTALEQEIQSLHRYTLTKARVSQWEAVVKGQIESLQRLLKLLQSQRSLDTGHFQSESKSMQTHLYAIKKMVVDRNVTSAEIPTIKIYRCTCLVEDVFVQNKTILLQLKRVTCALIGSYLIRIPPDGKNQILVTHFKEPPFRLQALEQLEREAQFLANLVHRKDRCHQLIDPVDIQRLAAHLAWQKKMHELLIAMPCVAGQERSQGFKEALSGIIENYVKARGILDRFWKNFCSHEKLLEEELDHAYGLLHSRLLLMDEEIREENKDELVYPRLESRNPKRVLDEQLFLLHTAYLLALSCWDESVQKLENSCAQFAIKYVHLKLRPSIEGTAKKRPPKFQLFIAKLLGVLRDIEQLVETAWDADPDPQSSFARLHKLFVQPLPQAKVVIQEFTQILKAPLQLTLPLRQIVERARNAREEINTLCGGAQLEKKFAVEPLQRYLNDVLQTLAWVIKSGKESIELSAFELLNQVGVINADEFAAKKTSVQNAKLIKEIQSLHEQIKKVKMLEGLPSATIKQLLVGCSALRNAIKISLIGQPPATENWSFKTIWEPIEAMLSADKRAAFETVGLSWDRFIEKLNSGNSSDFDSFVGLNPLISQMEKYFEGKGKNKAAEFSDLNLALQKLQASCWNQFKPSILKALDDLIQNFEIGLNQSYYKKLQQLGDQLCLGIRLQTYYTKKNENMTCYLWNGDPFDATTLHTENETHLPLAKDEAWQRAQQSLGMREFMNNQHQALQEWESDFPDE